MRLSLNLNQRLNLQRFFRGEGPETGPVELVQRRVYILPTRQGLFFAAMMLVMLFGSINYNNSLGYTLTFLLASVSIVSILHTYRNLLHLRVDVGHIAPVFCGETLQIPLILDNLNHASRYAVTLQLPGHKPVTIDIPAHNWLRANLSQATQQRGRFAAPRITLRTAYPLGLFHAWAYVQTDNHYLVYPAPEVRQTQPREYSHHHNRTGNNFRGQDDFVGLRNYHPGDSPRQIHWKALARGQSLQTKQFGGDAANELWLDWDALPELKTEERLSRLTRWIIDADTTNHHYGLRIPGKTILLGHGAAHRHHCLEALALFQHPKPTVSQTPHD